MFGRFFVVACAIVLLLSAARPCAADFINVPDDVATIQGAIDIALDGDVIIVSEGTYNEAINFLGKAIVVRSTDPGDASVVANTVMDGTGLTDSILIFDNDEGPSSVIRGMTFTGGDLAAEDGGAITIYKASPTIDRCVFLDNHASSGGAIAMTTHPSSPIIDGCTFIGNSASNSGGAIQTVSGQDITISGCTFENNTSSSVGGAIYSFLTLGDLVISSCSFVGHSSANGGAMRLFGHSNFVVEFCDFSMNGSSNRGGGIQIGDSTGEVRDCTFEANTSDQDGAGIGIVEGNVEVRRCTFTNNHAVFEGGGLEAFQAIVVVSECEFEGNTSEYGGGVQATSCPNIVVSRSDFVDNIVTNAGGAMHFSSSDVEVRQVRAHGNAAADRGGAIFASGTSEITFEMKNSVFTGNSGDDGGAMYFSSSFDPLIANATFVGNSATSGSGGAMYISNGIDVTMTNSIVYQCGTDPIDDVGDAEVIWSIIEGGFPGEQNLDVDPALVDADGNDDILGTIDDNVTPGPYSPAIDSGWNDAPGVDGSGQDVDGDPRRVNDLAVVDTGIGGFAVIDRGARERQENSGPADVIIGPGDDLVAYLNQMQDGDRITVEPGIYTPGDQVIRDAITMRGTDPDDPDVVAATIIDQSNLRIGPLEDGQVVEFEGFTVRGATSDSGGGVEIRRGVAMLRSLRFLDNIANDDGGGLRITGVESSGSEVIGCWFESNDANQGGGAAVQNFAAVNFTDCTWIGNSCTRDGGGLVVFDDGHVLVERGRFIGNMAQDGGGVVGESRAEVVVSNSIFTGNEASRRGGAIEMQTGGQGTFDIIHCSIANNIAPEDSGSIHNTNSTVVQISSSVIWGNVPGALADDPLPVRYSTIEGGADGEGNLDLSPMFADIDGVDDVPGTEDDDLRLTEDSPGLDAGTSDDSTSDSVDLDGNPRRVDALGDGMAIADQGCFEFQSVVNDPCAADLNGDDVVDVTDLLALLAAWGDCPDGGPCPADLDDDGAVGVNDLLELLGIWGAC